MRPVVIIGSGLAGISLLRELRKLDREVAVTVITGDDGAFYAKPNLSNAFALGKNVTQLVQATAAQLSEQLNARFLAHTQAQAIRTNVQVVETSAGEQPYGKLVLAVGAHPSACRCRAMRRMRYCGSITSRTMPCFASASQASGG